MDCFVTTQAFRQHLAIDVGNTRIKFGLFAVANEQQRGVLPECVQRTVVLTDDPLPWELLNCWKLASVNWRAAVIAGSNPEGVRRLQADWPEELGPTPQHITNNVQFPLDIRVDEPRRVGIDRLLNAVAVNELRDPQRPAVIVDSGTATTVDLVTADGAFAGGAILPGLALSAKALHEYTALLPLVSVTELGQETPDAIGLNTRAAIRSGLFWGQLGAVKELIDREAGPHADIFVTGGGGALLTTYLPHARFESHLPLQGLVLAATHKHP
jgi:type III pantothenate kinase